jgi:hypothetical protein
VSHPRAPGYFFVGRPAREDFPGWEAPAGGPPTRAASEVFKMRNNKKNNDLKKAAAHHMKAFGINT